MEEEFFGWLSLFLPLVIVFWLLSKRRSTTSIWLRIAAIGICLTGTAVLSITVHWLIMSTGEIDTSGFLNINESLLFSACWIVVAVVSLALIRIMKHRLQGIYKTVLVTQAILTVLPLVFFFILFVLATAN